MKAEPLATALANLVSKGVQVDVALEAAQRLCSCAGCSGEPVRWRGGFARDEFNAAG
ncbi:hypothetical protein FA95DRAFT_1563539 [Auriscalpium vulgare]|uniref:Uncharacterized protein n=1 Tax=Auriscalpium vulgare TaxID=40419 RepID=A0ACB8RGG0_9AGAM|nr:hypothetical protein FA95DRAFT_1563539 [Auriscalpium vulgare]